MHTLQKIFQRLRAAILIILAVTAATIFGSAAAQDFIAGVHYKILPAAQPVQTSERVEVAEVFWYRCPHCYNLQPALTEWAQHKSADAELVHVPAVLNARWAFDARLFYTIAALDLLPQLHAQIYTALNAHGKSLATPEQFAAWAAGQPGVTHTAAEILSAFKSFGVAGKVQFARVMSRKYGVTGTPSFVVDGKYRTSVTIAGDVQTMFAVIDHLIARARNERN